MNLRRCLTLSMLVMATMLLLPILSFASPSIVSTQPENGSTDVSVSAAITAVFSEEMDAATLTPDTFTVTTGTGYNMKTVAGNVTYDGTTATFTPTSPLDAGKIFTVTISKSVKNAAGDALASDYTWQFTTSSASGTVSVISASPADNADVNTAVTVTFSADMNPATLNDSTFFVTMGTGYAAQTLAGDVACDGSTATFTPSSALAYNTTYTATVTTGAKDTQGNALAEDYIWAFTTKQQGGGTSPEIASVDTFADMILITFSQDMDCNTLTAETILVKAAIPGIGYGIMAGDVMCDGALAGFTPYSDFRPDMEYSITLTTDVRDADGNALASDYTEPLNNIPTDIEAELQAELDITIAGMGAPGGVLYAYIPGEGEFALASGVSNTETGTPVNPDDHFKIASITKTFTAATVLLLAGEELLNLDDPIENYVPDLEIPKADVITVRQLLNHTSGLGDYIYAEIVVNTMLGDMSYVFDPEELVEIGISQAPDLLFEPGTGYRYSNTGYIVLGLIIETVTGSTYEEEVRTRLIEPLGLTETLVPEDQNFPMNQAHGYMMYGGSLMDVTWLHPSVAWAAGGMISTSADLGKWAAALFGGQVLKDAMLDEMLTFTDTEDPYTQYGLGVAYYVESQTIGHTGGMPGYVSLMQYHPQTGEISVFITNISADQTSSQLPVNEKPDVITGKIVMNTYDGVTDDLLTAGLGAEGLAGSAPVFADPEHPTTQELRRSAIYTNYRAIVDTSAGSGYGVLYGPHVGTEGDGKIAGKEYLAYADDGTGNVNVTLMVQIPDNFDPEDACMVTAPSSGSRGIYGAIGSAGEWGLKHGCAVAYTDKGTGMGVHDLDTNTVNLITGERADASVAGKDSNFTSDVTRNFLQNNPHRVAFKHAHSQQNPEKDWGKNVLDAVRFAFYVLNLEENYGKLQEDGTVGQTITPENTLVIASSVSNGGGSSIRAAEQDTQNLIDGVAVSEPNVYPAADASLVIQQGDKQWAYPEHSKGLLDYYTLLNLYQPCANLAPENKGVAPFNLVPEDLGINRCTSLKEKGLLQSDTTEDQAIEAQNIINSYGILEDQNYIQPSHHTFWVVESIAVTYANSYGRFSVNDNLCGFSFAGADAETREPAPLSETQLAGLFSGANGIPPTGGVSLINNNSLDGAVDTRYSISESGVTDQNLDGALCLRSLVTGTDAEGNPLDGDMLAYHERVAQGVAEIQASGDLHGLPVVIVHGRNDAILPPNHTSRPYFGLNKTVEGNTGNLHYYEVTNAHHLDAFNAFPGFNSEFVPLHHYYVQALDLMYDHLKNNTPLPPDQVVRTIPRGVDGDGSVPALTEANLPAIADNPAEADRIVFDSGVVSIPE